MQQNKPQMIVITGPTATGKTLLGIRVAKMLGGEIISADSMQVYKYMDIGTAKPSRTEMDGIAHHMIDVAMPRENYSVSRYVKNAVLCVDDILRRNKLPIVVGGSGLYIDSLIRGRAFASRADERLRKNLEARYDEIGGKAMLAELRLLDEKSAGRLHENDKKRIVRAFEVIKTSGAPLSKHNDDEKKLPARYSALKFAVTYKNRDDLYNTINCRVDDMIAAGLDAEVASLLSRGVSRDCTSMQAIGYKEIAAVFSGETDMISAIRKIKTESTRYAKRQLTWLRRDGSINWIYWKTSPDIDYAARKIMACL